jgi:hypothetical protein
MEASKGFGPEKGMKIRKVSILFEGGNIDFFIRAIL